MSKSIKFKPKYTIGTRISFTHKVTFGYNDDKERVAYRDKIYGEGIVVGCRRVPLGKYVAGSQRRSNYFSFDEEYEQPSLNVTHTQPAYLVRLTMFGKEFQALPEDIKPYPRELQYER